MRRSSHADDGGGRYADGEAAASDRSRAKDQQSHHGHGHHGLLKLAIGAIGVVFGDIGTSPLYAIPRNLCRASWRPIDRVDPVHIYGVLSLVFWSMMIVVTFKYVTDDHARRQQGRGRQPGAARADQPQERKGPSWTGPIVCWACSRPRCSMAIR
jgi:KUP system potassium uptake protein